MDKQQSERAKEISLQSFRHVSTGVPGLDEWLQGGWLDNTVTVVAGASGTGKSTLAMQFLLAGLDQDEQGLYITTDATPDQIVQRAWLWGWERVAYYMDYRLFFFATSGQDFRKLIDTRLPHLVEVRQRHQTAMRIVIDSFTPIIWTTAEVNELREQMVRLFALLSKVGPLLVTLEDYGTTGNWTGVGSLSSSLILRLPFFLADNALFLRSRPTQKGWQRTLDVIKVQGIDPGPGIYPYALVPGQGVVVQRVKP